MSETPRTEAEVNDLTGMRERGESYTEPVSSAFARQLEAELRMTGDHLCEVLAKSEKLETALTAAQAAIKRRDEVIEALVVAGPEFCPAGMTCGALQCTDCWRNWVDAKLKEGAK